MCEICQEMKLWNLLELLRQYSDGDELWQKIGFDLFEIVGKYYLVVVDYYFNFIEIDLFIMMMSVCIVILFKKYCVCYGILRMIVLDGGLQFISYEFNLFVEDWGINYVILLLMYQRVNGKVEFVVKIMKFFFVKIYKEGGDFYEVMLE